MCQINAEIDLLKNVRKLAQERTGKAPSPATVWRWVRKGIRGVRLQAVLIFGQWHTSPQAWAAFVHGQTAAALATEAPIEPEPTEERKARLKAVGLA